ncbi:MULTISPECIES: hypothetical protein [Streptosporangium]|uniref:Uncharacterized protein n=1 Tax=Streptosporangium brasiliense TaxID=47480 RepID=A0ABT9RGS4_9ACTN|nr:hypothetical protein [Streptosporangium brasiliense]MDP9868482.1 hypothetical protein [Streptosporangium brasiliense]
MVLTTFGNPSETTLRLLSQAVVRGSKGTGVGAAWVARTCRTAIDVLAEADSWEEVLERVRTDWS